MWKLPPSKRALEQHTRRAYYQAGYVWQESFSDVALRNPKNWRWVLCQRKVNLNMLMSQKGLAKIVNVVNQDWLAFQCAAATANACNNKKFNMF